MRKPVALLLNAGNKLLDVLPPRAETQAWKILQGSHLALYRGTAGRVGGTMGGVKILLLHHIGAKSGAQRVSPLLYIDAGDDVAVIASKGGHVRHPAWFHNLMANPDTIIELGREHRAVHARVSEGSERERLWKKAAAVWPDYDGYQERADRQIPVVVLERA